MKVMMGCEKIKIGPRRDVRYLFLGYIPLHKMKIFDLIAQFLRMTASLALFPASNVRVFSRKFSQSEG